MLHKKTFLTITVSLAIAAGVATSAFLNASNSGPVHNDQQHGVLNGSGSGVNNNGNGLGANKPTTSTSTSTTVSPSKKDFTISGDATGLFPGGSAPLLLTISNPNNFPIKLTALTVAVGSSSNSGCATTSVTPTAYTGGLIVPKNGNATTPLALRMSATAANACQGVTFTLLYSGTAEKA